MKTLQQQIDDAYRKLNEVKRCSVRNDSEQAHKDFALQEIGFAIQEMKKTLDK